MMEDLPRLAASGGAACAKALARCGALIIDNVASNATMSAIASELEAWRGSSLPGEGPFFGKRTHRFSALFAKSSACARLALEPLVLDAVEDFLLANAPGSDAIQLGLTQAIGIGPGEPAQALHRDDTLYPFPRTFDVMINALWPLDEFTEENGATRIIPGSHNWPRTRVGQPHECAIAQAAPGSVILWLGSTIHGGGANRSNRMRWGLTFSYSLAWLAQSEKLLLSIPPETARRLPERLQRLLGYQVHRPNLGWIEGRDPIDWLNGRVGAVAAARDNLTPEMSTMLAARAETRPLQTG